MQLTFIGTVITIVYVGAGVLMLANGMYFSGGGALWFALVRAFLTAVEFRRGGSFPPWKRRNH